MSALVQIALHAALAAHLPSINIDGHGASYDPWVVQDIDLSIVLYDTVTCNAEELWMRFQAEAGDRMWVQLGVPVIERLVDYRPSIAILAPGLPEIDVPFTIPAGLGGVLVDTSSLEIDDVGTFYEPFTQTESWVLDERWVDLPEAGLGYIVAWDPTRQTGKQWVAVGTVEDFSGGVDVTFDDVKSFHELPGFEPETTPVEDVCGPLEPEGESDTGTGTDSGTSGDDSEGSDAGTGGDAETESAPDTDGDSGGVGEGGEGCRVDATPGRGLLWFGWMLPFLLTRRRARQR